MSYFPTRGRQVGLTLVELLISIVLGLIVVGAVTYLYVGSKGAYRGNESQARIQEAGRFALDSITREIRRAGALGCGSLASITTSQPVVASVLAPFSVFIPPSTGIDPTKLTVDPTGSPYAILGFSPAQYAPLPTTQPSGWTPPASAPAYYGGDILQVQIASGLPARMSAGVDTLNAIITIASNALPNGGAPNFIAGDYALLADCSTAAVLQVTQTAGTSLTYSTASGTALPASISVNTFPTVQHFDQITYYVGQVQGRPALYRYSMRSATAEEVVENVEDMDVLYGVGSNGTMQSGQFKHAPLTAAEWAQVISVRVSLTAVGDQFGVAPAAQSLALHGAAAVQAPDTRLRQIFSATAALRDRLQ